MNRAQIEHILESPVLKKAFEDLESKWMRHMVAADTIEQADPHWRNIKALKALQTELKSMYQTEKAKER